MITDFKNFQLIKEHPDHVYDKDRGDNYGVEDNDAIPFSCDVNSEHTEINNIYFGAKGIYHQDIPYMGKNPQYIGRLWLNSKIISFWVYPSDNLFKKIIEKLEKKLKLKIFNNDWRIEVLKNEDNILKTTYDKKLDVNDYYFSLDYDEYEPTPTLIPIEDYVGSENQSEKDKLWHLMNAEEKKKATIIGKKPEIYGGSKLTGWDSPNNIKVRQAKYQESVENEKQFREVNLKDLWNDYVKYYKELTNNNILNTTNFSNINSWDMKKSYFNNMILTTILKNKEVSFNKSTTKYYGYGDDDVSYSVNGRVEKIIIEYRNIYGHDIIIIIAKLFDEKSGYIMSKFNKYDDTPGTEKDVVKIYNSQITRIEYEINMLKNKDKYNL
jgi:hypothetical protein